MVLILFTFGKKIIHIIFYNIIDHVMEDVSHGSMMGRNNIFEIKWHEFIVGSPYKVIN